MGKSELLERADALERGLMDIGRAAKASGVSVKMIRHYEAIGLLPKVARTFANYRVYRESDVHTLRLGLWQNKSRSSASVKKIAGKHVDELNRKIVELRAMVDTLQHLTKHCHGDHRPDCPILDDLSSRA
jgi:MerR family transcriptional regulator, copper efflux regulator